MSEIHNIEEKIPHMVSMVICLACYHRWVAVRPETTRLFDIECAKCSIHGMTIETGELIDI